LYYLPIVISLLSPILLYIGRNIILNFFKQSLLVKVESFKHELDIKNENIKNEMLKEAQKISFLINSKQVLYPEFYEKIKKAEGSVGGLHGLTYALTFEDYIEEDFKIYIQNMNITHGNKKRLLDSILLDRSNGVKLLKDSVELENILNAKNLLTEARNFLVLKKLYCSELVSENMFEIFKILNSIIIDIEQGKEVRVSHRQISDQQKRAEEILNEIEAIMKKELFG
jgi:hypothetical protein